MAVQPAAAQPTLSSNRACSLPDTGRPASPHFAYVPGLKVREEGEHYLPDLPRRADDEEYQADPHTGNVRRALKHRRVDALGREWPPRLVGAGRGGVPFVTTR
jgi:hypothetical protein